MNEYQQQLIAQFGYRTGLALAFLVMGDKEQALLEIDALRSWIDSIPTDAGNDGQPDSGPAPTGP